MKKHFVPAGVVGAALVTAGLIGVPGVAVASNPAKNHAQTFAQAQQQLELQLSNRSGQLARLVADVNGAKTLTSVDAGILSARISTDTADIDALATKVPSDTTWAELHSDQSAMVKDNRVYAVMTPQVFETIEADSISSSVAIDLASEPTLQSSVSSLTGLPGYNTALNHYNSFVKAVTAAATDSSDVESVVLAQTPADFPGDTHVFVKANERLRNADISLAYATYDASVIGLASGGYTGS